MDRNRELHVEIGLNLPTILNEYASKRFEGKNGENRGTKKCRTFDYCKNVRGRCKK
jgi:hypothetical protein